MRDNELIYRGDSIHTYATSIAATWVWAPAIFVASSMAYFNGLYGFLWFLIPNSLTIVLFGLIAQKFVNEHYTDLFVGITDLFEDNKPQEILHTIVSSILLLCSNCVQIIGLHCLLQIYFPSIPIYISAFIISIICYVYTKFGGIKACIISDKYKYIVIFLIGLCLVGNCILNESVNLSNITFFGVDNPKFIDISLSFGIISAIGLLSAPYVDNTLWQRVFSIEKHKVFYTYFLGSLFFIIIPILFGIIGFINTGICVDISWNITKSFGDNIVLTILLSLAICLALIATLDSNLCAFFAIVKKELNAISNWSMEILLIISSLIVILFEPTIVEMFLIYGTIRTAISLPTIMIVYNVYDKNRLFWGTLIAVLIGSVGYITMNFFELEYGYIFTIFALLFPLLGYKSRIGVKHENV